MIEAVAGQTAPIYRYLRIDGATPTNPDGSALTMSGMSCELVVSDYSGNALAIGGTVTVEISATWLVKISPVATDLIAGNWRCRIKVTDGAGKIAYFPSQGHEQLVVRSA
jgi:hypothetical protein